MTPKECWRLQGFPDWAYERAREVPTSDAQMYRQAGNSIAVPVLRSIFRTIDDADIQIRESGRIRKRGQRSLSEWGDDL